MSWPTPGGARELAAFAKLQARLPKLFRKVFSEKDVLLLESYQRHQLVRLFQDAPRNLYTALLAVLFFNLFLSKILANGPRPRPPFRFALVLLITTTVLIIGYLTLTPLPVYGMPFCMLPMLIIFLNHGLSPAFL